MTRVAALLVVLAVAAAGCRRGEADRTPRGFEPVRVVSGPVDAGFGVAVAFDADGALWVGAPWAADGGLFREEQRVLAGEEGAWLGAALAGGGPVRAAAPGLRGGVVLDAAGAVVAEGEPGDRLGSRLIVVDGAPVSIGRRGVVGPRGWATDERLWSLAALRLDDAVVLVAGQAAGGVQIDGRAVPAEGATGRGLAACDVDGDGRDELIVADPRAGRVAVHVVADPTRFTLDDPAAVHALGPGAGLALLCVGRGLVVGAPDRVGGGGAAWLRRPLTDDPPAWLDGVPGTNAGHSLAWSPPPDAGGATEPGTLAVGDPAAGRVVVLRATSSR